MPGGVCPRRSAAGAPPRLQAALSAGHCWLRVACRPERSPAGSRGRAWGVLTAGAVRAAAPHPACALRVVSQPCSPGTGL